MMLISTNSGNTINTDRVIAIISYQCRNGSKPIGRVINKAIERNLFCNISGGRKIRSLIFMDDGHIIAVPTAVETLQKRWEKAEVNKHV